MLAWLKEYNTTEYLTDWEFAAATGSTLGMFMLTAIAYNPELSPAEVTAVETAYFPWICGLHIQLDYFIDQVEDLHNGDLNFVFYYKDEVETVTRLQLFYREAYRQAELTPHNFFTKTIVRGLLALYLSDQKIKTPTEKAIRKDLLHQAGVFTQMLYALCKLLRFKKTL
jgi:tetraprenyl-beta-curcumene synthase